MSVRSLPSQSPSNLASTLLGSLALTGSTVTASSPLLDMAETWNNAAVAFTGWRLNVTDTASAAGSLLLDLRIGGSTAFSVRKDGYVSVGTGANIALNPSINAGLVFGYDNLGIIFGASSDLRLVRDAANTLALRNGTAAQAFRVYNTYTDGANYERAFFEWVSNDVLFGTTQAGTGASRNIKIRTGGAAHVYIATNGTDRWYVDGSAGHFIAGTDNTYDIGTSGASRPRNVYVAGTVFGSLLQSSGGVTAAASSPIFFTSSTIIETALDGNLKLSNYARTTFGLLQFGGTTNLFPALKRSATTVQARLADDTAFAPIQGKITTDTAYTAGAPPAATGYVTIYDSTGTAYRVAVVV